MSSAQIVSGRLEDETLENFRRYHEDLEISKSEALRQLVERGIEAEPPTKSERWEAIADLLDRLATGVGIFTAGLAVLGLFLWAVEGAAAAFSVVVWWAPYVSAVGLFAVALAAIVVNGGLLALRYKGYLS